MNEAMLHAAHRALVAAGNEDRAGVEAALAELNTGGAIGLAILGWIDTVALRMGIRPGQRVGLVFAQAGTTNYQWADTAPRPSAVWAGQLFTARINRDRATFAALLGAIPEGQAALYLTELLQSCGLMYRNPPPLIPRDQIPGGTS